MIPSKRFKIDQWIEALVHNYGQQGVKKPRMGRISKVDDLPKSCPQKENAVALLLISDLMVYIPAVLTKQAWEKIQFAEDRVDVSNLKGHTVVLQGYSLKFQCEAEISNSKFFLTVEKMSTVAFSSLTDSVPCCTSLPTVRQKICEIWKSLQGENSLTSMNTQSGPSLSQFLIAYCEDEMSCLLADLKTRLAVQSPPPHFLSSSPLPQPSSSRVNPLPSARSTYLPTGWQVDRVQYKGQEGYTFTGSHFYIPAEQLELMQRHPEGRGEPEPQNDNASANPDHEQDLPDSGEDGSSLMPLGEQGKRSANPWDVFTLRVENLSTSSLEASLSGSPSPDLTLIGQSPSLLPPLDRESMAVPRLTSPQALPIEQCSSRDLFSVSDQSSEDVLVTVDDQPEAPAPRPCPLEPPQPQSDKQLLTGSSTSSLIREILTGSNNQTLPPYQKPRPHNASSCSPVRKGSSHPIPSSMDNPGCPPVLLTGSPDFCWEKPTTLQLGPPTPLGVPGSTRKTFAEADTGATAISGFQGAVEERRERRDGRAGRIPKRKRSQTGSPPSWLYHTQAAGRRKGRGPGEGRATGEEVCPASTTNIRSLITMHPDGTPFLYRYQPTPQVAEALSLFRVPNDLVRWSVRYLLGSDGSKETS